MKHFSLVVIVDGPSLLGDADYEREHCMLAETIDDVILRTRELTLQAFRYNSRSMPDNQHSEVSTNEN